MNDLRSVARIVVHAAACLVTVACESTSLPGLNVREHPSTSSPVVTSIDDTGTRVDITCHVHGEPVRGDTVWWIDARVRHQLLRPHHR